MKTASHTFNTVHGEIKIDLEIFTMDAAESIDVYGLSPRLVTSGAYRIEATINGTPRGAKFYPFGILGAAYFGEDSRDAAREFLADAHQDGFFAK
jgi:hypothetical protein